MVETPALPDVHLAIMQPAGYVHSLAFLDPARYVRYQLRRFGVNATMAKNRLREDAVNLVFGAHLGFPPDWRERNACLFVNLEQLGPGGAKVSSEYLRLLKSSGVVDYDITNVGAYGADPADVPLVPFLHAPYLEPNAGQAIPLSDRPIDLLFFGSLNERRRQFIKRIEACGTNVAVFDSPLYAEERDVYIRQAKAVLNCHYYDSATFEQVRAFHCLSLGTPVISERCSKTRAAPAFEEAVIWIEEHSLENFFVNSFGNPDFYADAEHRLEGWRQHDPVEAYADLMVFAGGFFTGHGKTRPTTRWRPTQINLGSGKDYKPGWLNLDVIDRAEPDLVLDLGKPQDFPIETRTRFGTELLIETESLVKVYANNVLEHVPDLPCLMTNILSLLRLGGEIEIEVPYEKAVTAWQDPTHIRAMNENSWLYYTDWFWYLGWFEHRFKMRQATWLDSKLKTCEKQDAAFMRVTLVKVLTTPQERTHARVRQADVRLPEDVLERDDSSPGQLIDAEQMDLSLEARLLERPPMPA